MSKELYIAALEELVEEYIDHYPSANRSMISEKMADHAYHRMKDNMADMIDMARMRNKDG